MRIDSYGFQPRRVAALPYAGDAELLAAQLDPKYGKDPKYTQDVMDRAEATFKAQREATQRAEAIRRNHILSTLKPFADAEEIVQAMGDKRYQQDPDYTAEVLARIEATELAKEGATVVPVAELAPTLAPIAPVIPVIPPSPPAPQPFRSDFERKQAYNSPRYANDPDYRAEVEAREAAGLMDG